jgi:hypothetical protein
MHEIESHKIQQVIVSNAGRDTQQKGCVHENMKQLARKQNLRTCYIHTCFAAVQGGIGPAGLASEDLHVLDFTDIDRPRWHRSVAVVFNARWPAAEHHWW